MIALTLPVTTHLPNSYNDLALNSLDIPLILELGLWRQAPLLVLLFGQRPLHSSGTELPAPLKGMRGPLRAGLPTEDFGFPEFITAGGIRIAIIAARSDNRE